MKEKHRERVESKEVCYRELEEFARGKIREHLQDLLEQEVTKWLGRGKSERRGNPKEQPGYRNGYGKKRRFTLSLGTIDVQFFFNETKSKDEVSRFCLWDSRCENPVVGFEKRLPYLPQDQRSRTDPDLDIPPRSAVGRYFVFPPSRLFVSLESVSSGRSVPPTVRSYC